ncbi:MAG: cytochrome c biogenesis protein CcdA [Bacteroidota bacterium]
MNRLPLLILLFCGFSAISQILAPASWSTGASVRDLKAGETTELVFSVRIDPAWYLYSTEFNCDDGPIKTTFTFQPHPSYELVGKVVAVNPVDKHDDIFGCDVRIFKKSAEFRQKVRVLKSPLVLKGMYEYQVCTEATGQCVPGDGEFDFSFIKVSGSVASAPTVNDQPVIPAEVVVADTAKKTAVTYSAVSGPVLDNSILTEPRNDHQDSFFGYLIFAFILGLASLITPCVFPMVPMTVTFFLRDNQTRREGIRKAIIFGVSIITIYTLAGTLFAVLLGTDGLNALATHWAPNLFIFVLFLIFALSFFGLFEINAPHQLVNSADRRAEKGGLAGIFFMAATLVLVSFSCTVPIVGNVLFMSAGGHILKPIAAMFAYALAFAIPFTLFAAFPEWIKGLPKSGGWLNTVKVTLGFLELALSLKFFSIADQAYHWGLLDREINIALWIVIFALLGLYLLGKIRLSSDTPVESVSVVRLLMVTGIFSFVVYLIPGLWGAPLKALAGYLPPLHTHDFNLARNADQAGAVCDPPKYDDFLHLPHGISGYFDYQQALECARKKQKPLFLDFTGHGCTNCREMEAVVWSEPEVLKRLKNEFVVVALYVDDKTELPESEWITSKFDGKVKKTIGKKNADLQIANLENNAQPFYVLVGPDEKVLAWPYAYDRDPSKFVAFLEQGLARYRERYR